MDNIFTIFFVDQNLKLGSNISSDFKVLDTDLGLVFGMVQFPSRFVFQDGFDLINQSGQISSRPQKTTWAPKMQRTLEGNWNKVPLFQEI